MVKKENPQTWNRYAYVTNNPLSFTDPTGRNMKGPGGGCDSNLMNCAGGAGTGDTGSGGAGGSGTDANGMSWGFGPGSFGGPGNPYGLPSGANGLLLGELRYLQTIAPSLYGPGSSVTLGSNGFVTTLAVSYWGKWVGDCPADVFCVGNRVYNLFQFTTPAQGLPLFAGVLPPGMDGAAQAAAQMAANAARNGGWPRITPPRAPVPVPNPNQIPQTYKPDPWWINLWSLLGGALDGSTEFFVPIFSVSPCVTNPYAPSCNLGVNP